MKSFEEFSNAVIIYPFNHSPDKIELDPMIDAFFIINRSGGLIYRYIPDDSSIDTEKVLNSNLKFKDLNNLLVMNSFLHTIIQMIDRLYYNCSKLTFSLEKTKITVVKTITNYTFVYISNSPVEDLVINLVLDDFQRFVMMNPGYFDDMPINLQHFKPEKHFSAY